MNRHLMRFSVVAALAAGMAFAQALPKAVARQRIAQALNLTDAQKQQAKQNRQALMAARAEALAKFYNTLTPEQRAKADLMAQQVRRMIKQRIQQRLSQASNG